MSEPNAVVVRRADPKWRRFVLTGKGGVKKQAAPSQGAAVVTTHDDGTFSLRLIKFDLVALRAVKAAAPMTWDADGRVWIIWGADDRQAVLDRLGELGYRIALR